MVPFFSGIVRSLGLFLPLTYVTPWDSCIQIKTGDILETWPRFGQVNKAREAN